MMERLRKAFSYWPEFLIFLVCGILLVWGICQKKGYHQDEMLSFEFANAEFNPWIVPTQPQGRLAGFVEQELEGLSIGQFAARLWELTLDVVKNRGNSELLSYKASVYPEPVWIERQSFIDYITVDNKDAFLYLSVYFNSKDDSHPPLYYMALHTVSSLFRKRALPWMGCSLNLLFVFGVMFCLMKLGRKCMILLNCSSAGRIAGDGCALLYGLSMGALSTTLLIRMYAMLTFFCILLLWLHMNKLFGNDKDQEGFQKHNKILVLITVLGFWTQYFFLFYCLPMAAVTVVMLFRAKRTKEVIRYLISMMTAALIAIIGFPFAIQDVLSGDRGTEVLHSISQGLSGYADRITSFASILCRETGIVSVLFLLLICLSWGIIRKTRPADAKQLATFLIVPGMFYFFLAARVSPFLVDRYIMPLFPLVLLVGMVGACSAICLLAVRKEKLITVSLILMIGFLSVSQIYLTLYEKNPYFYESYVGQEKISEQYAALPCICVYDGVRYYENLPEFTHYEKTLLLTEQELEKREEKTSLEELSEVVLLIKEKSCEQEILACMEQYHLLPEKVLYAGDAESDTIILLQKEKN